MSRSALMADAIRFIMYELSQNAKRWRQTDNALQTYSEINAPLCFRWNQCNSNRDVTNKVKRRRLDMAPMLEAVEKFARPHKKLRANYLTFDPWCWCHAYYKHTHTPHHAFSSPSYTSRCYWFNAHALGRRTQPRTPAATRSVVW